MVTPISASAMCQASTCTGGVWFLVPTVRLWGDNCVKHCISLVGEGGGLQRRYRMYQNQEPDPRGQKPLLCSPGGRSPSSASAP